MHSTCLGKTLFECRFTFFTLWIHDHQTYLVTNNFQWLLTNDLLLRKLPLHPANVFLFHLSGPYELLHHSSFG